MSAAAIDFESVKWYAVQTRANHEKTVYEHLQIRSVPCFLPIYTSVRRRKDRKVSLERPLFPGYLFVNIPLKQKLGVLSVPGAARLVGPPGNPAPVSNVEVEALREAEISQIHADPYPYLTKGMRVRAVRGPFEGLEGFLVRKKNASARLVVTLKEIASAFAVEMDICDVEPVRLRPSESACA